LQKIADAENQFRHFACKTFILVCLNKSQEKEEVEIMYGDADIAFGGEI